METQLVACNTRPTGYLLRHRYTVRMNSSLRDIALDALLHPFSQGQLHWPDQALFLRARAGSGWQGRPCVATQPFRPEALRLQQQGIELLEEEALPSAQFPLVLVLPPRQREEARALLAKACAAVAPGGVVVAAVSNDEGAKTREAELQQLAGSVSTLSKYHSRVFWTRPGAAFDTDLLARWAALDVPRAVPCAELPGGHFQSRPGVFAWDRVDAASRMLVAAMPATLHGRVADFGAGWGYLSLQLLARCPQIESLDVYEADARALALARQNLATARVPVNFHWADVEPGVAERFDAIVCNPPFHAQGRGQRPDIGRAFIAAAAAALKPRGSLWLVANRHLPYEYALGEGFKQVQDVAQNGGFKIVHAVKA
jgi:16S rRNA (guanine1207-N2)-methyltransferase